MTLFSIEFAHTFFGFASLAFGLSVFLMRKGTSRHKLIGKCYVGVMLGLNLTAFGIYKVFGGFGLFHWLAVLSLATLIPAYLAVLFRTKIKTWLSYHYEFMAWSYIGLLAATSNEAFVHLPFLHDIAIQLRWLPISCLVLIMIVGNFLIYKNKPFIKQLVSNA
jgi:uncharacterized membrane protein